MQSSLSNTSKEEIKIILSLSVCPSAGFSVAHFHHQLLFERPLTVFECNVGDVALADQVKKWYELESYGTFKEADPRSAADNSAQKFLTLPRFMIAAVMLSECSGLMTIFIFPISFTLHWFSLGLLKSV